MTLHSTVSTESRLRTLNHERPDLVLRLLQVRKMLEVRKITSTEVANHMGISRQALAWYLAGDPKKEGSKYRRFTYETLDEKLYDVDQAIHELSEKKGYKPPVIHDYKDIMREYEFEMYDRMMRQHG